MNGLMSLATMNASDEAGFMSLILAVIIGLIVVAAWWQVFEKAKQPGWAAIIPIYNAYILLKVAKRPGWWLLLYLIPVVNLFTHAVVAADVAERFNKSTLFGIFWIWLFSPIGMIILGFGDAKYRAGKKE